MRTKKNETTNKNKVAKMAVASFGAALTTVMGGNIQGAVVDLTANLPSGSHPGGGGGNYGQNSGNDPKASGDWPPVTPLVTSTVSVLVPRAAA